MNIVPINTESQLYRELLHAVEQVWATRQVPQCRELIARIFAASRQAWRRCEFCRQVLDTEDPRTTHCSRVCAQQHRRVKQHGKEKELQRVA